jgi:predicted ATPase
MLGRLHIENYKCLRDVTVDLGHFTILIGPNDSGKSSFLDVVRTLGRLTQENFQNVFAADNALDNLVWRRESHRKIIWEVAGDASGDAFAYHIEIPIAHQPPIEWLTFREEQIFGSEKPSVKFGNQVFNRQWGTTVLAVLSRQQNAAIPEAIHHVRQALGSTIEFHFDPAKMSGSSVPQPNALLNPTGDNLAGFLDSLLSGPDRSAFRALEADLHAAIPTLSGIALPAAPNPPGAKCIRFVLSGEGAEPVTIPASLASGGALLLTAFLALSYSKTPDVLLFEEPENGLHPSRLQFVVDVLRKMTTGELGGRARQVIVTTHNPLLLNFARPEEVRVFVRDPDSGTRVSTMASIPDVDRLLKEFALGELWYMLGEEKLFEGQPA